MVSTEDMRSFATLGGTRI